MKIKHFEMIPTIGDSVRFLIEFKNGVKRDFERSMNEEIAKTIRDILYAYGELDREYTQFKKDKSKKSRGKRRKKKK